MGKSIRVSNGKETLEIQDTDLQNAVKDGYLPTERVIVGNSKTRESYEIDPKDLPNALNDGFSFTGLKKKDGGGDIQSNSGGLSQSQNQTNAIQPSIDTGHKLTLAEWQQSHSQPQINQPITGKSIQQVIQRQDALQRAGSSVKMDDDELTKTALERLSHPDNQVLFKSDDPVKGVHQVVSSNQANVLADANNITPTKFIDESAVNDRMKELVEKNIFKSGTDASQYLNNLSQKGIDPSNNETAKVAKQKVEDAKQTNTLLNDYSFEEAALRKSNPSLDDKTFFQYQKESNAKAGTEMASFLNDPDVIDRANNDPKIAKQYKEAQANWYSHYPQAALTKVTNQISQAREDEGHNSGWYNSPSAEVMTPLVEKWMNAGKTPDGSPFTSSDYEIYKTRIEPVLKAHGNPLQTTGFIENLGAGVQEGVGGIAKTIRNTGSFIDDITGGYIKKSGLAETDKEHRSRLVNDQYSDITVTPKRTATTIGSGIGHFTGYLLPMLLPYDKVLGLTEKGGQALSSYLMFEGQNAENALIQHPDDKTSQVLHTALGTLGDMFLARLLPTGKLQQGIRSAFQTDVASTIEKLASGEITKAEASNGLSDTFKSLVSNGANFGKEIIKGNTINASVMTGFSAFHQALDAVLGGKNSSLSDAVNEDIKTFKTAWLSSTLLSAIGAKGVSPKVNGSIVREMAENKDHYESIIQKNAQLSEVQKTDILQNLNDASLINSEIQNRDDLSQAQKDKFLLSALSEKVQSRKAEELKTDVLKSDATTKAKEAVQTQENIISGKDQAEEHKFDSEKGKILNDAKKAVSEIKEDSYSIAPLKDAAENDEPRFIKYMKEISDQANDDKSKEATLSTYGEDVVNAAQKLFPKEIKTEPIGQSETSQPDMEEKPDGIASDQLETNQPNTNETELQNTIPTETKEPANAEVNQNIGQSEEGAKLTTEEPPIGSGGAESPTEPTEGIGIKHSSREARAEKLDEAAPERGAGLTIKQAIQKGRDLISNGSDPEKVGKDFRETGKISEDDMSIVRARNEQLARATNKAAQDFGISSQQYKDAKSEESKFYNETVKPMQTAWSNIGRAQQGETDIDTGSLVGMQRAFEQQHSKEMTAKQSDEAKGLSDKVSSLTKEVDALKKKLSDTLDKGVTEERQRKSKKYTEKAKNVANRFRKLKSNPLRFTDESGNEHDIKISGITWNDLVETGAKAIEKTGEIADGIAAVVDKIKDSDFYKGLSDSEKDKFASDLTKHYEDVISETPESKRIKKLEKELEDLKNGIVKPTKDKRDISEREQDLRNQIKEEKKNLGLGEKVKPPQVQANKSADDFYDLAEKLADKKGNDFTPDEAKSVWDYAKTEYLDKDADFDDMISGVAMDLGLTNDQVRNAIAAPKGAKPILDEMYRKQNARNNAKKNAEDWVKAQGTPRVLKVLKAIPRFFFGLKVFGHGTVGMITHAGTNLFDPVEFKRYWKHFALQFKFAYGDTANYEKSLQDLQHDPQYTFWKRNGLAIDPTERYDDYQFVSKFLNKIPYLGKIATAGDRGFNALKFYRLERAKSLFNGLSQIEKKDPNTFKNIATLVNHSTGASKVPLPEAASTVFFAPRLEGSRWSRLIVDPVKAVNTFADWKNASAGDKVAARIVAKRAGRILATYTSALLANQAMLSISGSNQKINFFDPTQSDWLKFKAGGKTFDLTGGMVSLISFLGKMVVIATEPQKNLGRNTRKDAIANQVWNYASGKFSPFASTVKDVATQHDFSGNTLPFSNDKPSSGKHKLTWLEYIENQQSPIPISEAFNDAQKQMDKEGVPKANAKIILSSIAGALLVGGTGLKLGDEPQDKPTPFDNEDKKDPTFKYFIDKGLDLPNTSPASEIIKDENTHTEKKLNEYPKEVQDNYSKVHKAYLKEQLDKMSNETLYVNDYGEVSTHKSRGAEAKDISELNEKQLTEVLHLAQAQATKKTKKELFNTD